MFIVIIIGLMGVGVFTGYSFRKRKLRFVNPVITGLIWILLFLLGTEVGGNRMIIEGLHTLGLQALGITLAAVAGSVLCAWGLWLFISSAGRKRGGGV